MMGSLDTSQDFLCELGMKINSHLVGIVIFFTIGDVTNIPTKINERAPQN